MAKGQKIKKMTKKKTAKNFEGKKEC